MNYLSGLSFMKAKTIGNIEHIYYCKSDNKCMINIILHNLIIIIIVIVISV